MNFYITLFVLSIFAGQALKADDILIGFPRPNFFPAAPVEKPTVVDDGFLDFIQDVLGLKKPTGTTTKKVSTESEDINEYWMFDVKDKKSIATTQKVQQVPSISRSWWDNIFGELEDIFNDNVSSSTSTTTQNAEDTFFQPPLTNFQPPLTMNIDSNGFLFKNFAEANPPSDSVKLNLHNNTGQNQLDVNKNEKQILAISVVDDSEEKFASGQDRTTDMTDDLQLQFGNYGESPPDDAMQNILNKIQNMAFCQAKCIQQCITVTGRELDECKSVCSNEDFGEICAKNDEPCLKACSKHPINYALTAPTNVQIQKINSASKDLIEVSWSKISDAVIYVLLFMADSNAASKGFVRYTEDVTNETKFVFRKEDACIQYRVKVSAVQKHGITPFSDETIIESDSSQSFLDLTLKKGETSHRILNTNQGPAEFVEIEVYFKSSPKKLDLTEVMTQNTLHAYACKNFPLAQKLLGANEGVLPVDEVQFLFLVEKMIIRLPIEYVALQCSFKYTLFNMNIKCAADIKQFNFGLNQQISLDFQLGCEDVPFEGCQNPIIQNNQDKNEQQVPEPSCQPLYLEVNVKGNSENQYNTSVSWNSPQTNDPAKFFVLRHGSAIRPFVRHQTVVDSDYVNFESDIVIQNDGAQPIQQMTVVLKHPLPADDLHVIQICSFWRQQDMDQFDWSTAPTYVVDMVAARPKWSPVESNMATLAPRMNNPKSLTPPTDYYWLSGWSAYNDVHLDWLDGFISFALFALFIWFVVVLLKMCCRVHNKRPKVVKQPLIFVTGKACSTKKPLDAVEP